MQSQPDKSKLDLPLELDPAMYLDSDQVIAEYLRPMLEEGDARMLALALKDVVWAQAVTRLSKEIGLSRPQVFRGLTGEDPLSTDLLFKVLKSLGLKLSTHTP